MIVKSKKMTEQQERCFAYRKGVVVHQPRIWVQEKSFLAASHDLDGYTDSSGYLRKKVLARRCSLCTQHHMRRDLAVECSRYND